MKNTIDSVSAGMSGSEFIKRAAKEDSLVTDILNEGILIYGKPPQTLME